VPEVRFSHRTAGDRKAPWRVAEGIGAMEGAVFALLGLLGFSYSGATSRLEARRNLIVQEANAIGTAYLRIDLAACRGPA